MWDLTVSGKQPFRFDSDWLGGWRNEHWKVISGRAKGKNRTGWRKWTWDKQIDEWKVGNNWSIMRPMNFWYLHEQIKKNYGITRSPLQSVCPLIRFRQPLKDFEKKIEERFPITFVPRSFIFVLKYPLSHRLVLPLLLSFQVHVFELYLRHTIFCLPIRFK